MAITQSRSKRKITGGRYISYRKKRLHELGKLPRLTKLGERKIVNIKGKFDSYKQVLHNVDIANIYDPKNKKYLKVKIITIVDNPANRNFVRRNIMNKGTIIKTELGNARITSRPGQEGTVNAILVD